MFLFICCYDFGNNIRFVVFEMDVSHPFPVLSTPNFFNFCCYGYFNQVIIGLTFAKEEGRFHAIGHDDLNATDGMKACTFLESEPNSLDGFVIGHSQQVFLLGVFKIRSDIFGDTEKRQFSKSFAGFLQRFIKPVLVRME